MTDVFKNFQCERKRQEAKEIALVTAPTIDKLSGLTEIINESRYRIAYRLDEFAIKKIKSHISIKILFINVHIPTPLFTLFRFGIRDFNEFEYDQFQSVISRIPADLHTCFAKAYRPIKADNTTYSINQLVINDDGMVSKMLREYGKVNDKQFWSTIDRLENLFLVHRIYFFGVGCNNICVRQHADGRVVPVLIDYKRVGIRTFWHQLWLFLPSVKELKLRRRFDRLRKRYKSS